MLRLKQMTALFNVVCSFGNFQKLYFVEIKQVKARQRQEARSDAIKQLHFSISFFRERIDLSKKVKATHFNSDICN